MDFWEGTVKRHSLSILCHFLQKDHKTTCYQMFTQIFVYAWRMFNIFLKWKSLKSTKFYNKSVKDSVLQTDMIVFVLLIWNEKMKKILKERQIDYSVNQNKKGISKI